MNESKKSIVARSDVGDISVVKNKNNKKIESKVNLHEKIKENEWKKFFCNFIQITFSENSKRMKVETSFSTYSLVHNNYLSHFIHINYDNLYYYESFVIKIIENKQSKRNKLVNYNN